MACLISDVRNLGSPGILHHCHDAVGHSSKVQVFIKCNGRWDRDGSCELH